MTHFLVWFQCCVVALLGGVFDGAPLWELLADIEEEDGSWLFPRPPHLPHSDVVGQLWGRKHGLGGDKPWLYKPDPRLLSLWWQSCPWPGLY